MKNEVNLDFLDKIKSKEMREVIKEGMIKPSLIGLDIAEVKPILMNSKRTKLIKGNSVVSMKNQLKKIKDLNKLNGVISYIIGTQDMCLDEIEQFWNLVRSYVPKKDSFMPHGARVKELPPKKRKMFVLLSWDE